MLSIVFPNIMAKNLFYVRITQILIISADAHTAAADLIFG